MSRSRAEVVQQIRALRAVGIGRARPTRIPRQLPPTLVTASYRSAIVRGVLDRARALVIARVMPLVPEFLADIRRDRMDAKGVNETVDEASREFFEAVKPRDVAALAETFAKRTSDWNRKELAKQVEAAVGVNVIRAEPEIGPRTKAFTAENVALITSIPNKYFDDVAAVISRGAADGLRATDIAALVRERYDVSAERAALIARDQVGKFYGAVNQVRQENLGVTHYIWRTVDDNRVRAEHEERNGERFAWDGPPDEDGHPGKPINCRCFADPDLTSILEAL